MSILIFMVSDKMPSTSSFIPLIGNHFVDLIPFLIIKLKLRTIMDVVKNKRYHRNSNTDGTRA